MWQLRIAAMPPQVPCTAPNTPRSPRDPGLSKRLLGAASKRRTSFHLFRHSPKAPSESSGYSGTHESDNDQDFNESASKLADSLLELPEVAILHM
ncbi:hypothetical protein WJX74_005145 [Apatococcus lobatus]|uniref:Uncharacterized protein n=1 Tax=Apatococcus lobatus TaxID=904363 RepID=A0AAW1RGV1_9CHLO